MMIQVTTPCNRARRRCHATVPTVPYVADMYGTPYVSSAAQESLQTQEFFRCSEAKNSETIIFCLHVLHVAAIVEVVASRCGA